ncbi:MAG: DNA polymerase III subunit chi, partial [Candidatus Puniceispirillaceae bacterium]
MPQVDFYHLTKSELPDALVMLIEKSRQAGRKTLIQCPRPAAEVIDDDLWTKVPDSWLPHGLDDA